MDSDALFEEFKMKHGSRCYRGVAFMIVVMTLALTHSEARAGDGWQVWGQDYFPEKPARGGVLRVAAPFYIGVMNPNHFPVMDWVSMGMIYERLVCHDASYKPIHPWLAESWQYLDDVTVLMTLRKGVRFHDGTFFNAHALKYQMEWILDKTNGAWTRAWLEPLDGVEVVDDYTVKWHFKEPWGAFLGTMASVPGFIISAKALRQDSALAELKKMKRRIGGLRRSAKKAEAEAETAASKRSRDAARKARVALSAAESRIAELQKTTTGVKPLDAYPVGTGQYMLDRNSPGNYISLKRNPDWWFGQYVSLPEMPYFDGIKVSVIPDPSVRLASLKAGRLDYVLLNPYQYRIVDKDPNLNGFVAPLNWLVWLMLNQAKGPCTDIRVRKAISHAIDRKALIVGTQAGMGREASSIFPAYHWARNPNLLPVAYNPELSKKLLAEAGYANGLTLRGVTANVPVSQAFAKAVMAMLEKVGIHWDVKFVGIAAMADPFMRLDYDMCGGLYQWIFEPDLIASALYMPNGVLNYGRNNNPEVIALIRKGRKAIKDDERKQIYQQLEQVLYDNYMDIYLWYPSIVVGSNTNLRGYNAKMHMAYGDIYTASHPLWFKGGKP